MQTRYAKFIKAIHLLGDILLLNLALFVAGIIKFGDLSIIEGEFYERYVQLVIFLNLVWLLITQVLNSYNIKRTASISSVLGRLFNVFLIHVFALTSFIVIVKGGEYYSREFLLYFYSIFIVAIFGWRYGFLNTIRYYRVKGFNYRRVLLVGHGQAIQSFYSEINNHPEYGLRFMGYFTDTDERTIPYNGKVNDLYEFALENDIDEIYCSFVSNDQRISEIAKFADQNLIRFRLLPNIGIKLSKNIEIEFFGDTPVFVNRKEPLELFHNRVLKRLFDIVFSSIIILVFFPILIPVLAIAIKLESKGSVFFKQSRTGLKSDSFICYKFRSMQLNSESDLRQAREGDERITKVGRFLRQHNLDELPQFFNVLIGQMSVVGPRPHMLAHTEQYSELIDAFMVRHLIKPGITGLSQIRGLRGETADLKLMEERVKVDVYYLENWSFFLDVKIVAITLYRTFVGDSKAT